MPVGLCLHILPDASLRRDTRLLVGPANMGFGGVRFLFECFQAGWISQQKSCENSKLAKIYSGLDYDNGN